MCLFTGMITILQRGITIPLYCGVEDLLAYFVPHSVKVETPRTAHNPSVHAARSSPHVARGPRAGWRCFGSFFVRDHCIRHVEVVRSTRWPTLKPPTQPCTWLEAKTLLKLLYLSTSIDHNDGKKIYVVHRGRLVAAGLYRHFEDVPILDLDPLEYFARGGMVVQI